MTEMNADVIIAGGDDIFFIIDISKYQPERIKGLSSLFQSITGSTFSFGTGKSIEAAYVNLRRAKSSGPGNIIEGV
jgi:hypothetical protein